MDLVERERRKYERMWAVPDYSKTSPGELVAPVAFSEMGMAAGDGLLDFGCGQCKAVDWFRSKGVLAVGTDLVPLRDDVVEASLWDLPEITATWGFSADVMEHIPPEKVDDVLAGIRRSTERGAFLQIATRPDRMGRLIGETLHLTVQPRHWWVEQLKRHWSTVKVGEGATDWQFWAACT
jgi:hypothetical protein